MTMSVQDSLQCQPARVPELTLGTPDLPSSQIRELGAGTYGERAT